MLRLKLYCPFSLLPQLHKKDVTILEMITLSLSIVGILLTITLYSFSRKYTASKQSVLRFLA